ncbi:T9SS type A sorting domain-containing protein [Pontibacter qinzhouensis]|uniref:T9SS type A sorting domain-containing protein n=1 Tax=Pontibacter qinzhouensis TaxID=2603253 RepID=A0A5C8KD82_9BACT|nr:T9SS type A sorting domain-containing protein [Pontibacter qinzhouensis]TXK51564.1 T9SS type A sorting domain-containing protein [Pontibacter qinzhouensis]
MKQLLSLRLLLLLCFCGLWFAPAQATHLRGGYITYTTDSQNPRQYLFRMVIFRDVSGVQIGDKVSIFDGLQQVEVSKQEDTDLGDNISRTSYTWSTSYPADGTYTVTWTGINRNSSIINVAQPSDQHSLLLRTTVTVSALNPDRHGISFLNPSSSEAYVGTPFKYNLQAYDADGDSLVYTLTSPYRMGTTGTGQAVPGYTLPSGISVNQFGEINWPNPSTRGEYAFAVEVKAYRNRRLVSTSINDLQVLVRNAAEAPDFTLTNQNRLITATGLYILAKPESPLKLSFFVRNPTQQTLQVLNPVTELQEPHLVNQSSLQVIERDSADGIVKEIIFTPDNSLRRGWPYALSIRGELSSSGNTTTAYKREFVYLLIADQLSTSLPDLLPELAHLLYPNPAGRHFMIEAPAAAGAVFRLYALDGRLVQEQLLQPGKNKVLRKSDLSTGLYTYSISSEGYRSRTGKLFFR